ncbi:V-type ATP synthase subunit D [Candidatus Desantisbacteria bacterium CG07_land_8_20_14_0_80_39_15]|uniref:V-type ATP synthase subunit D n=1 Tax=Candidatus Desantisbacteria bacterium CG07_land_8_20_14_0_80_39_15 TaxID=1974549 RepID=A0A2M6ZFS5_9BACT|nr:MAG: V-type ATP synthase subunit D [Candidatus Desantisbacteria bacterium CG07_land_8_20_14_0_80_39_15]
MIMAVNPTRMELLRLRKRLILARRGHKLLRDKQDELLRHFLDLIKKWKNIRETTENRLVQSFKLFQRAFFTIPEYILNESCMRPGMKMTLSSSSRQITNVRLPQFSLEIEGDPIAYGFIETTDSLDKAILSYLNLFQDLIKLAEMEKGVVLLAEEIKKTRRRVNALEYVLIPNLEETTKYISMKLEEFERGSLVRLMKVKEIVRAH